MLGGEVCSLFREFGIVLAVAVANSGVLSLSICPVLANLLLLKEEKPNRLSRGVERVTARMTKAYRRLLARAIAVPAAALGVAAFVAALSVGFYSSLPKEPAPSQDRGTFNIDIDGPQGASLAYADRYPAISRRFCNPTRRMAASITGRPSSGVATIRNVLASQCKWPQRQFEHQVGEPIGIFPGSCIVM